VNLGPSHPGVQQGFFVPAYLIRGDEKRQLKPAAPQLRKVADLKGLWELFRDPDQPLKGRFWGAVPGWLGQKNVQTKFKSYGLDERFRLVEPTSGPALEQSVERAYHAGEPWVGYYWTPDALTARLDLVMLEEPPFDKWTWEDTRACAFPASEADVIVHKSLLKTAPDAVKFLTRYDMPTEVHNRLLTRQREVREPLDATVEWFMREYPSLWPSWTTFWAAENIRESRKRGTGTR
jgi:ABC-type proline/glycine betaine transport system substrate-binding protein